MTYPIDLARVVEVLGGQSLLHLTSDAVTDLAHAIADGLPAAVARNVAISVAPLDPVVQRRVMGLVASPGTLKRNRTLSPEAGKRAERLARVAVIAHDALGGPAEAQLWLTQPHMLFGHRPPIEVAASGDGFRQVERMLYNIEYSLPV